MMTTVMTRAQDSQIISPARPPTNSRPIVPMSGSNECSAGRTLIDFITATSFGAQRMALAISTANGAKLDCLDRQAIGLGVQRRQFTTSPKRRANIVRLSKSKTLTIAAAALGHAE